MKKALVSTVLIMLLIQLAFAQTINLKGRWKFHVGDDAVWASQNFNDSGWGTIRVPATWEDEGFNGYDGFAWYRTRFDGRKLNKNEVYYLNLGFIDDADEVYLNGNLIGFSGNLPPKFKTAYNSERKYVLPNMMIDFGGENVLAIRVFDAIHAGGIVDGDIGIFGVSEGARLLIDLQGIWSFAPVKWGENIADVREWKKLMVPGAWDNQGYKYYDGFAWYKRTFSVPKDFTDAPLVLLLGKIDDFDKVYLNGKLIGITNDHKGYGNSRSYEKNRVYSIPPGLLKPGTNNTIEILVEDIGNFGGIYEGIVGITTKSNYDRYFDK